MGNVDVLIKVITLLDNIDRMVTPYDERDGVAPPIIDLPNFLHFFNTSNITLGTVVNILPSGWYLVWSPVFNSRIPITSQWTYPPKPPLTTLLRLKRFPPARSIPYKMHLESSTLIYVVLLYNQKRSQDETDGNITFREDYIATPQTDKELVEIDPVIILGEEYNLENMLTEILTSAPSVDYVYLECIPLVWTCNWYGLLEHFDNCTCREYPVTNLNNDFLNFYLPAFF